MMAAWKGSMSGILEMIEIVLLFDKFAASSVACMYVTEHSSN